jgi:aspartyl-tRNA(Asn)/glutamyl-tRNA(Gln) amidotransferase subunit A
MPLEVNRPEVVADITAVFERYEAALVANDVDTLDELFWDSPEIVRFGLADRQHGFADLALANAAGLVVSRCEAAAFHRSLDLDRSLYWEEVAEQLELGASVTAINYLDAQRAPARLADELLACFDDVDVLAMPTVPVVAPPVADFAAYLMVLARNAIPWSLVGFPARCRCRVGARSAPGRPATRRPAGTRGRARRRGQGRRSGSRLVPPRVY